MDFDLTEEQRKIQKKAREFAQNELLPHCTRWDRQGEFPRDLVRRMGAAGLLGSTVPREYGGLGTDRVTNGLIVEELARGDSNLSLLAFGTLYEMLSFASEELKREWAPKMARGERFLGIALTEPQSGCDAANVQTRAERRGEVYVANGVKNLHQCLLLHGHYGYSQELPVEQRLRDVLGWEIGDGTGQIQKLIIARELMGREFVG